MALSLLEIDELYTKPGALFSRVRAGAATLCRAWYLNNSVSEAQRAWASQYKADPTGVSTELYHGIITDSSVIALDASAVREGSAPKDADIMALIGAVLTKFVTGG